MSSFGKTFVGQSENLDFSEAHSSAIENARQGLGEPPASNMEFQTKVEAVEVFENDARGSFFMEVAISARYGW